MQDELTQQRRDLPWEAVEKSYIFDGPSGKMSLADLFSSSSQLIVYHFMFNPSWDFSAEGPTGRPRTAAS
ncbi:DUF899 family protein [Neobacillus drentensis]|uniref:DUF899 family protein n=1 Tax=Neobacillus drentensis TaxID=220684 RepID=UPI002856B76C|nr:putative dithiol-disulfide oxidoreductase (DUF899 family) [Neobacillus drentensis]